MSPPSVEPVSLILGIPGLVQVIAHACRRIKNLQDTVKGAVDLCKSLETLAQVLEDIYDEYRKSTSDLIPSNSRSVTSLGRCIKDCERTILKIDDNLRAIQNARKGTKTLKAWWEDNALKDLQTDLERQKNTLHLKLNAINREYDRRSRNSSLVSLTPSATSKEVKRRPEEKKQFAELAPPRTMVTDTPSTFIKPAVLMIDGSPTTNPDLQEIIDAVNGSHNNPFSSSQFKRWENRDMW